MRNLFPTHTCFDDAAAIIGFLHRDEPDKILSGHYNLVHGITRVTNGESISHAWIESPEHCYDMKILDGERVVVEYIRAQYYETVLERTVYTIPEALVNDRKYGHCGPWVDKYREMCGASREVFAIGEIGHLSGNI